MRNLSIVYFFILQIRRRVFIISQLPERPTPTVISAGTDTSEVS